MERPVEDPNHYREYRELGVQGVPTFVIGSEVLVGFNGEQILSKLDFTIERCPNCQKKMRLPKNKGTIRVTCPECEYPFTFQTKV